MRRTIVLSILTLLCGLCCTAYAAHTNPSHSPLFYIEAWQRHGGLTLLLLLGLGLLLAFTPCVLPTLPILATLILNNQKSTTYQAFKLAVAYVLGMSLTYTSLGVLTALLGHSMQAFWQKPVFILVIAFLLGLLALSMLDVFQLKLPTRWQTAWHTISQKQTGGHAIGAFFMGMVASLILSPCTTPAMIAILLYVHHTGNLLFGGAAFFALSIGMGIPIVLVMTLGKRYLPRSGKLAHCIQRLLGVLLMATTIWLLQRLIEPIYASVLWVLWLCWIPVMLGLFASHKKRHRWLILASFGISLIAGFTMYHHTMQTPPKLLAWQIVRTQSELTSALNNAKQAKCPVVFTLYADWCTTCQMIEHHILPDPLVQERLKSFVRLKYDVTHNRNEDQALLEAFQLYGTPSFLFFNREGKEMRHLRLVGSFTRKTLQTRLTRVINPTLTSIIPIKRNRPPISR